MTNIFLFTGENVFALRQEVSRWMQEFREKHGEANLSRLEGEEIHAPMLVNEVSTAPFIATHRLVVVEGVPAFSKEEMVGMMREVHPQAVLVFVDPKPDRRLAATKELLKAATIKAFPLLRGEVLRQWMRTMLEEEGATAEEGVLATLVDHVGEDQQALRQELQKLTLYAHGRAITRDDVEQLTLPSAERTVWALMDYLGEGRAEEAVRYAHTLLRRGESPQSLWNIVLWMLTSLVAVVGAIEDKATSLNAVVQTAGVKFGTARSLLPLAKKFRRPALAGLLHRAVEADIALKTGAYRVTADAEEELAALIDRCLLAFAG